MKAATANAFYILVVATVRRPVADTFLFEKSVYGFNFRNA